MSEAQNKAFELAIASVSMETDKLTDDVVSLIREAILENLSTAEVISRLFP